MATTAPVIRRLFSTFLLPVAVLSVLRGSAAAQPVVNVHGVYAQQRLTVTIRGSGFPEMKRAEFTCSYDPLLLAVIDAIVASALPSTALSATVDTAGHTVTITVNAASTVSVAEGAPLITLRIPSGAQEDDDAFTVTTAIITDKNGSAVNATINPSTPAFTPERSSTVAAALPHSGTLQFQLNGRSIPGTARRFAAGCTAVRLRDIGSTATFISIRQP